MYKKEYMVIKKQISIIYVRIKKKEENSWLSVMLYLYRFKKLVQEVNFYYKKLSLSFSDY